VPLQLGTANKIRVDEFERRSHSLDALARFTFTTNPAKSSSARSLSTVAVNFSRPGGD
jgi:hypothetical protein